MAVIGTAHERIDARSKREFGDNEREYTRRFWVETSLRTDDPSIALTAVGIPQQYQTYNTEAFTDLYCVCSERSVQQHADNPKVWEVECRYTTLVINIDLSGGTNVDANPLLDKPEIEFGFESKSKSLYGVTDPRNVFNGGGHFLEPVGITNSAGEAFDPPIEIEVSYPILTIVRNEELFSPNMAVRFQDAVNSDTFWGVNAHCARVRGIHAVKQFGSSMHYWRVTYTIAFNRDTWDLQILDYGTYYIDASDAGKIKPFLTADKVPKLGNLTAAGDDGGTTIHMKTFSNIYREEQFSLMNLPTLGQIND